MKKLVTGLKAFGLGTGLALLAGQMVTAQDSVTKITDADRAGLEQSMVTPISEFTYDEAPDDHVIGAVDAPDVLMVYASVTCPHCADWFTNQWPVLKTDMVEKGKLRFIFRELPTPPAQIAEIGFIIAECAPDYDYMSVIEYQMTSQSEIFSQLKEKTLGEVYSEAFEKAGLKDEAAITECFNDESHIDHIKTSSIRAQKGGVSNVPSFFINGEAYKGKLSADAITSFLETGEITPPAPHAGHENHENHD